MSSENFDFSKVPTTLNVTVYGNLEKISDTLSKGRVRIFYKGMNRNRTFISEDFANQLISSLPYTPIKGIFDKDTMDYSDHGEDNSEGRIYGIVPENTGFAWEQHQDIDGVVRTYACADVLLFTGLYEEAKLIFGKSQSMEIYRPTLQGEWRINEEDNQPYYYFEKGSLVGLQVLGDLTEPCFEGAEFFGLIKDLKDIIEKFNKKEVEKASMDKTLFRLSDNEKADILFDLLNPNFNEEGQIDYLVCDVYDDYALCRSRDGFTRVYYSKNEDSVSIGDKVPVRIVDITETEYAALEAIKATNGSYEVAQTAFEDNQNKIVELEKTVEEFKSNQEDYQNSIDSKDKEIAEYKETITGLEAEKAEFNSKVVEFENKIAEIEKANSELKSVNSELVEFKKSIETEKKKAILDKYEQYLSESMVEELNSKINSFSVEDFKKEVCTAAVESDSTIFEKRDSEPKMVYKNDSGAKVTTTGAIGLIEKYKNGGNK